jgi:triphosphoribosyl-dephospho-CoA synthase
MISTGLAAQLACIWEVSAHKPGNVHRHRDFDDTSHLDFLASAAAIAPVMDRAAGRPVGETVLAAVEATRQVVRGNTNLGIILLFAPLAAIPREQPLREGLAHILDGLTVEDSRRVYEAIRLASPAGLGDVPEQDIHREPTLPLREIMRLAEDRDLIARQYVNGYEQVFDEAVPLLQEPVEASILRCQLELLSRHPDTLIARKRGIDEARAVSEWAMLVLRGEMSAESFDARLREGGHTRNPGTTADLIAAALFVALLEGSLSPSARFE